MWIRFKALLLRLRRVFTIIVDAQLNIGGDNGKAKEGPKEGPTQNKGRKKGQDAARS